MDNIILGKITKDQERFLEDHLNYQEVSGIKVLNLVASLASVPYLHNVRMQFYGGPISGARLGVVADADDAEFSRTMAELGSLNDEQRAQRIQAQAVLAYERLEQALARPGLFQHVDVRGVPAGHPLENRTELDHYALQGSLTLGRNEGTQYKVDLTVPVELHVLVN